MVIAKVAKIALAFPEATRVDHGSHVQFLVKKKTFAYYLDNHHGDGIISVCCKLFPGDNNALVQSEPKRFYLPAYMAHLQGRADLRVFWAALPLLLLSTRAPEDGPGALRHPGDSWRRLLRARRDALLGVVPGVLLFLVWVVGRLGQPSEVDVGAPWKACPLFVSMSRLPCSSSFSPLAPA